MSATPPDPPPGPLGLDPDRAVAEAGGAEARGAEAGGAEAGGAERPARRPPERPPERPVVDTRRYRWMIGSFGLALVVAFSTYTFTTRGVATTGIPAGRHLHPFVAPLATSALSGDANVDPRCDPAHPNPQALNVCGRTPLVLAFFATRSGECIREVDVLQRLSGQFPAGRITFAAVAVQASRAATARLVRAHAWTIPVAYDPDGAVGAVYGVQVCPMIELARRGGVVSDRLIGNHWLDPSALGARVRALLAAQP